MHGGIMAKAGYEHDTSLGGGLRHYLDQGYVPYPIPEGKFGGIKTAPVINSLRDRPDLNITYKVHKEN